MAIKIQPSPQLQNNLKRMGAAASRQPTRTFSNQNPGRIEKNPNPKRPTRDVVGETRGILAANEPYLDRARAHALAMQRLQNEPSMGQVGNQAKQIEAAERATQLDYRLKDQQLGLQAQAMRDNNLAERNRGFREAAEGAMNRQLEYNRTQAQQKSEREARKLAEKESFRQSQLNQQRLGIESSRASAEASNARAQIALAQQAQQRQAYEFDQSQKLGRFNTLMSLFR